MFFLEWVLVVCVYKRIGIKLLLIHFFLLNIYSICDVTFFSLGFGNFCLLFFPPWPLWLAVYRFYWFFSIKSGFTYFTFISFSVFFCFQFYWFLLFIISSLQFALDLIYSLSGFCRWKFRSLIWVLCIFLL